MADPSSVEIHLRRLHQLGGEGFVQKMIALFLQTAQPRVEAIRSAIAAGDLAAVEFAAHSLKSSAGNMGAEQVQDLAGRIEELAAGGKAGELGALSDDLAKSTGEAIEHLRKLVKSDAP